MGLCRTYQVEKFLPVKRLVAMKDGLDRSQPVHLQVDRVFGPIQEALRRVQCRPLAFNQNPATGVVMPGQPRNLRRLQGDGIACQVFQFDQMKRARFITYQKVRDTGTDPVLNPGQ